MVRALTWPYWLVVGLLGCALLCTCARPAMADDGVVIVDTTGIESRLDGLRSDVSQVDERVKLMMEDQLADEPADDTQQRQLQALESINGNLQTLVGQTNTDGVVMAPLAASQSVTSVAYANPSLTSQWAQYAAGMVPRLGWDEHYVYWQDGASSYMYACGDLSVSGDAIVADDATWHRWYWASSAEGYRHETGSGALSVSPGAYTLVSDLGGWPMLGDGTEQLRREVMLYALVAVTIYCLHCVWSFVLRYRDGSR